jgi:hypothetical protein
MGVSFAILDQRLRSITSLGAGTGILSSLYARPATAAFLNVRTAGILDGKAKGAPSPWMNPSFCVVSAIYAKSDPATVVQPTMNSASA